MIAGLLSKRKGKKTKKNNHQETTPGHVPNQPQSTANKFRCTGLLPLTL